MVISQTNIWIFQILEEEIEHLKNPKPALKAKFKPETPQKPTSKDFGRQIDFQDCPCIARAVFWKPGCVYVCMYVYVYVTHFEVCLEPYISLNS